MGLIICKKIVENHGGQIEVFSAGVNRGATFQFSMHMTASEQKNSDFSIRETVSEVKVVESIPTSLGERKST